MLAPHRPRAGSLTALVLGCLALLPLGFRPASGTTATTPREAFLTESERDAWTRLLAARLLDPSDLGLPGGSPTWVRPWRVDPFGVADRAAALSDSLSSHSGATVLGELSGAMSWKKVDAIPARGRSLDEIFERHAAENAQILRKQGLLDPAIEEPLRILLDAVLDGRESLDLEAGGRRAEELEPWWPLLDAWLGMTQHEDPSSLDASRLAARLADFDPTPYVAVARRLANAAQEAAQSLATGPPLRTDEDGFSLVLEFDFGFVVIGGTGRDVHEWPRATVVLDPAGDDVYRHPVAAADGTTGLPVAVAVDGAGDDWYASPLPGAQGAARLGSAVLLDVAGADRYEGTSRTQGSAQLGAAVLLDLGPEADHYRAGRLSQGAAVRGAAALVDAGGDDDFEAEALAQGCGLLGGAAALIDLAGRDRYRARGQWRPPLGVAAPGAWSQGASSDLGLEGLSGLGCLVDGSGDDGYEARGAAQAASEGGVALLMDRGGEDDYQLRSLGQAAARRGGVAVLLDLSGDDRYLGGTETQASAQLSSLALLLDRAGSDRYFGGEHSQCAASGDARAVLLDAGGADWYLAPSDASAQPWVGSGGGLAFLIDLAAGRDVWTGRLSEDPFVWSEAGDTAWDEERGRSEK